MAHRLFQPALSLRTQDDTADSQASSGRALDIVHFFVVHGKDKTLQKRVCRLCGQVFVI